MKNGWLAILLSFLIVGDVFAYKNMETFNHVTVSKSFAVTGPSAFTGLVTFTGGTAGNLWINGIQYIKTGIQDSGWAKIFGSTRTGNAANDSFFNVGQFYQSATGEIIDSGAYTGLSTFKQKGSANFYGALYASLANGLVDSGWATYMKSITATDTMFAKMGKFDSSIVTTFRATGAIKILGAGYFGSTTAFAGTQTDSSNLIVLDSARIGKTLQVLGNDWHKLNLYVGTSIYDSSWFYGLKSGTFTDTIFAKMGKFDSSIVGVFRTTSTAYITGAQTNISTITAHGAAYWGGAVTDSLTHNCIGVFTQGTGGATFNSIAGKLTITEDTTAFSGYVRFGGADLGAITVAGDSASIVINGTTVWWFGAGTKGHP